MNRIDRVTAILIQLQSRKIIRAQDIADRFRISLRTVYRDIRTLEEAGIPVLGEAGMGYSIMEGYRLPPVMFTRDEATAFLTAEKLIEKFTDNSTDSSYKSAMYKVRSVLRSTEKDMLEDIEDHIEVLRGYATPDKEILNDALQPLLKSISEKEVLHIRYHALHAVETTERNIEPIGVFLSGGFWHTIAFCRLRNDYRDFRTDRIIEIRKTNERFDKNHPSLKAYLKQVAEQKNLEKIVINVTPETARQIQQVKYYYGFVEEKLNRDMIQMTFLTSSPESFLRWFLMVAEDADIVSPASLQKSLRELVEKITKRIG
ncbi:MAG TPA: YafY family protein [Puia sp.]|nr:YafY family protein [Puia sp.]